MSFMSFSIQDNHEKWHDLGSIDQGFDSKIFDIGVDEIWVYKIRGAFRAISNICPHKMGPISEGIMEDDQIECPWHGYQFNTNSGIPMGKSCPSLRIYEVKVEDNHIFVKEKKL